MFFLKKEQLCKSKRHTEGSWEQLPPDQESNRKKEGDPDTMRKSLRSSTLA